MIRLQSGERLSPAGVPTLELPPMPIWAVVTVLCMVGNLSAWP